MYYDKRIRYLSYYESDIKLQNAGYAKFQVRDSLCQMIIYVKGPRLMGSGEASVYLLSRDRKEPDGDGFYAGSRESGLQKHLLGNLNIRGGQGHCAVRLNAENMADSGLRYDEVCGIKIVLHEYQYLESQWSVVHFMPERPKAEENMSPGYRLREEQSGECGSREDEPQVIVITEEQRENVELPESVEVPENVEVPESVSPPEEPAGEEQTQTLEEEIMEGIKGAENGEEGEEEQEVRLLGQELPPDKWEQLRRAYPIVHPIREEEEYLKITPKDFVIFTEKYQELVHNSFLLHGYYNYKHLILGKREKEGKTVYYLGVPGTFHDREKSVAVMFGFEAFDGKREPAEKGDFGYYLRRVEI